MMCREFTSRVLLAVMIGVVISSTATALGVPKSFLEGERYENKTGQAAYCLMKILYKYTADQATAGSDKFLDCSVTQVGDYHRIVCKDGEVLAGQRATVTFSGTARDGAAEIVSAKWYKASTTTPEDPCSELLGEAKAVASVIPQEALNRAGQDVHVKVEVENRQQAGTAEGSDIYYATWQGFLQQDDMTEVLWTCVNALNAPPPPGARTECMDDLSCSGDYPYCGRYDEDKEGGAGGIDWYAPTGPPAFALNPGESPIEFDLGMIHKSRRVLFRFYNDADSNIYGTDDYEVVQFWVLKEIPTVSEWGLVVMGVLLLTVGTIVFVRRRSVSAWT